MGETQNLRTNRVDKYDPLYGRFSRYIKTTDMPDIGHKGAPGDDDTAGWEMVSYTTDSEHALFPYIFTVHSTNTAAQFIVYKDETTTALSLQVNDTENTTIVAPSCDCPLMRIAPGHSVSIFVPLVASNTTDTYAAFLISKREPIPSVVEN